VSTALRNALLAALVSIGVCGVVRPAAAAGYWPLEIGACNFGRAGANIVAPGDPTAVQLNPSALAGLRGLQVLLDANLMLYDDRSFHRADDSYSPASTGYERVTNQGAPTWPGPGLFAAWNLAAVGIPQVTVGAGVYGPPHYEVAFDPSGPQRYSLVRSEQLQIHQALGLGIELPWMGLRLGFTLLLTHQLIDFAQVLNLGDIVGAPPQTELYDIGVRVDADQLFIPHHVFALSLEPSPWMALAISYQLPYDVRAAGKVEVTTAPRLESLVEIQGERVEVLAQLAGIFRSAIRFREPTGAFDVELAYVWESWGRNRRYEIRPEGLALDIPLLDLSAALSTVEVDNNWRDTHSVRLGGAYSLKPGVWRLRAGIFFETGVLAPRRLNASAIDLHKIGMTLGSRIELPRDVWIDLALGYIQGLPVDVSKSRVRDIDLALTDEPKEQLVIANGRYRSRQLVLMLAIGWAIQLDAVAMRSSR
jgi:long-chain fatty acid transport protein